MIKTAMAVLKRKDRVKRLISAADIRDRAEMYARMIAAAAVASEKKIFADVYVECLELLQEGTDQTIITSFAAAQLGKKLIQSSTSLAASFRPVMQEIYADSEKLSGVTVKSDMAVKKYQLLDFMEMIERQNMFFIKGRYDTVNDRLRDVLKEQFHTPLGRKEFGLKLSEIFSEIKDADGQYWETFGSHITQRVKMLGIVKQFEDWGVEYAKVIAQIDDKTTPVCRQMHGRIIPVKGLIDQKNRLLAATGIEEVIRAQDFEAHKKIDIYNLNSNDLPVNMQAPPYHFGCRTDLVAYYPGSTAGDTPRAVQYTADEKTVGTKAIYTVFDQYMGREIIATEYTAEHLADRGRDTLKILTAMDQIIDTAENIESTGNIMALTKTGWVLIFRGNFVHTAFKPRNPAKYFKKNTKAIGEHIWNQLKNILKSLFTSASTH